MKIIVFAQENRCARKRLINTPLQRGDRRSHTAATALAVFTSSGKTAEAVLTRVVMVNHLAKATC
jgi:hypothetical protein